MKRVATLFLAAFAGCAPVDTPPTVAALSSAVAPAPAASAPAAATPLRIIVVHWKIRQGMEDQFLHYWASRATIADRSGLVAEFLSSPADRQRLTWINWSGLDPRWTSFYNVGLWRDEDAFQDQIGRFIDNTRPPQAFEAAPRERVLLKPERWRVGASPMLAVDAVGVR